MLEPIAEGLNDWRDISYTTKAGGGDGDDSDGEDDASALIAAIE